MASWKSEQQLVAWIEWVNDLGVPISVYGPGYSIRELVFSHRITREQ